MVYCQSLFWTNLFGLETVTSWLFFSAHTHTKTNDLACIHDLYCTSLAKRDPWNLMPFQMILWSTKNAHFSHTWHPTAIYASSKSVICSTNKEVYRTDIQKMHARATIRYKIGPRQHLTKQSVLDDWQSHYRRLSLLKYINITELKYMHNDSIINMFLDFCYQDFLMRLNNHTSVLTFHYHTMQMSVK